MIPEIRIPLADIHANPGNTEAVSGGSCPNLPRAVVVVPCFNHGAFVAEAVRSALAQHGAEVRVVVVNDGSDDGQTAERCIACVAIDPARVAVIHQRNHGLPAARNAGAAAVKDPEREGWWPDGGDYLVFLDSDDWIEPDFVERLHGAIVAAGDDAVSHAYCQERLVGNASGLWRVPEWDPTLLMVTNLHPVTALVRRDWFERVGGFDETMNMGYEDWDLWLRFAGRGGRGVRVREPLFAWRRHSDTTMVMQAVQRHDDLFAMLVERHPDLYGRHARAVIARSNHLLRRSDANWLDETGDAICLRDLRAWNADLVRERDEALKELETLKRDLAAERTEHSRLASCIDDYEHKPSVKIGRRIFHAVDNLPAFLAEPVRALARWARKAL